jgi:uncharacterized RDD family membrane protein YckC
VADPYIQYTEAPAITYANWIQRVAAFLIDVAPPVIVLIVLVRINLALTVIGWLLALGWIAYDRWYLGGTTGQSLGKKALNIWLVGEDSWRPIGILLAFVRDVCHLVDSIVCYVGFLFPLWDARRQTLADKIVRTVVVPG